MVTILTAGILVNTKEADAKKALHSLKFALDEIERENSIDNERDIALNNMTSVATMDFLEAGIMPPARIRASP